MDMITGNAASALKAYGGTGKIGSLISGSGANAQNAGKVSFSEYMVDALDSARTTLQSAEETQIKGLQGKASSQEVVEAIMASEMTIQTITSVRDRAVQAYQELLRMPV